MSQGETAMVTAASEKKPKATKATNEKKAKGEKASALSHPPYFQMIKEALVALHERTGSSPYAIAKHMEENHEGELPANFRKILAVQLKNFVAKGKLVRVKASFKLSDAGKKEVKSSPPKPAVTNEKKSTTAASAEGKKPKGRTGTKRKATSTAAVQDQKPKAAKASTAKPRKARSMKSPMKPRQPKSIKSPGAKKARKTTAAN